MRVTPKTEKEIAEANLLSKGWYPCTVGDAEEKKSKAGNEMIEMNVKVYRTDSDGFTFIRDFLMDTEFGAGRLRHCADMCGLLADYEAGNLQAALMADREGWVQIGIEKGKNGYPDKNKIFDYAKENPAEKKAAATASASSGSANPKDPEDDIPF